jgi:hypothetical protein
MKMFTTTFIGACIFKGMLSSSWEKKTAGELKTDTSRQKNKQKESDTIDVRQDVSRTCG